MKRQNPEIDGKVLRFFSAIADKTRLKILLALMDGPKTVNEVYESVGREKMTLSAVSHQLKYLEQTGVVVFEKSGREKTFRPSSDFCWCILQDAYGHFGKKKCACTACKKIKHA
ncbi:MAG: metalloregulator ArsR/SmtB family transcription factor [Candidatus Diapherotrites archaeon]|nr:metalloregulator ArsR/SmtB family transcription factor [Candidatus Diapherotrites archaeon]